MGVQIELEIPHGVPTIGEKDDLLVELVALRVEHFEQVTFRFWSKICTKAKHLLEAGASDSPPRVKARRLFPVMTSNQHYLRWART
jgi:hypothetical protein